MGRKIYSWPGASGLNPVIDSFCNLFESLGFVVVDAAPNKLFLDSSADIFIIHWADEIFWHGSSPLGLCKRIASTLLALRRAKRSGTKIIWFVHNLTPHDLNLSSSLAWKFYRRQICWLVDAWITLAPSVHSQVVCELPQLKSLPHDFMWHPPYDCAYDGTIEAARAQLGIEKDVILFGHAGALRPYKRLAEFANRFPSISPPRSRLFLAGRAHPSVVGTLDELSDTGVLTLDARSLSPHSFDEALKAIDVFIAPYGRFLHSGAIIHALCRGCVIVAPSAPFTEDLLKELGPQWVILYEEKIERRHLELAEQAARTSHFEPDLSFLSSPDNSVRLEGLLNRVLV